VLFDLQTGKRRRVVQVVYSFLAVSFLIGFVIFGVGTGGVGSISDIFGSGGSADQIASQFDDQIDKAKETLATDPKDQRALLTVAKYQTLKANAETSTDPTTGQTQVTEEALTDYGIAADTWNDYLKVAGAQPDVDTAQVVVNAFVFLNDAGGAAQAQEIIAQAKPSAGTYGNLAYYLYFDGQFAAGDAAADKALADTKSPTDRKALQKQFDQVRKQAKKAIEAQKAAGAAASTGQAPNPLANPFGGLGDTGTTP
jgi:hypothetical protein